MPATDSTGTTGASTCFHCGLPVPADSRLDVTIHGVARPMCCPGCQAVAQAIVAAGHADYYRHRTQPARTGSELIPELIRQTEIYDHPEIQKTFVRQTGEHIQEAALILEGITCAACIWLNERHIRELPGVLEVNINYATHRALVRWDDNRIRLSEILQAIQRIGYTAHPYDPAQQQQARDRERRAHLRRIGIAGILGMQVMMISLALYAGAWSGIEEQFRTLLRWSALLLTLPVLLYSGTPFLQGAWRDLRNRSAGMDVPVALGILVAFTGSVHATLTASGEVYFDSVVMFVFFLLVSRYFELIARKRGAEQAEALAQGLPVMATRLSGSNGSECRDIVPAFDLHPGDRVLVKPGETVPADGTVLTGQSGVSEALLTGESAAIAKSAGSELIGGSINIDSPLVMQVEKTGLDTVLAEITRLLERAQGERPAISRLADRVAAGFVLGVLVLAVITGIYWWLHAPSDWLPVLVSVLVVTCPCALSLATPTALSAATGTLLAHGLLTTGSARLETMARSTHLVFDKTGTLTMGSPTVIAVEIDSTLDDSGLLHIAAALEAQSEHPIGQAIIRYAGSTPFSADQLRNYPGSGVSGTINGQRWYLGNHDFVRAHCSATVSSANGTGGTHILLADATHVHARFTLQDSLRPDAGSTVQALRDAGLQVLLMSGDNESAARSVADQAGITMVLSGFGPEDKLQALRALQLQGGRIIMVGDGINDAPVLGAADVSIAMQSAASISQAGADMILLSNRLSAIPEGLALARRTMHIIRQNLAWAVCYNLAALPAAACGYIEPWMAAVGMSLSSLMVVLNALRLTRGRKQWKSSTC